MNFFLCVYFVKDKKLSSEEDDTRTKKEIFFSFGIPSAAEPALNLLYQNWCPICPVGTKDAGEKHD